MFCECVWFIINIFSNMFDLSYKLVAFPAYMINSEISFNAICLIYMLFWTVIATYIYLYIPYLIWLSAILCIFVIIFLICIVEFPI